MADLIATKALKYATRRLLPDDHFTTKNERDARILIGIGKARRVQVATNEIYCPEVDELSALRAEYQEKLGKRPYHGWDAEALRDKIAAA
jgi:hypothetical protein